jgi:hypothetical protein
MAEFEQIQAFQQQVIDEIRLLQGRLPEWRRSEPYADHLRPLDPLERREAARLDRLLRQERAAGGERNRERIFRERAHPWSEDERWTLRKRVWRERRDRERELLEQREQTLLQREQDLAQLCVEFERWLADIQQLDPAAREWCAEQARLSADTGITPAQLDQIHQRRRQAAESQADELLARADVRAAISAAGCTASHDPIAIARALAPLLAGQALAVGTLQPPVVIAALVLRIARAAHAGAP